MADTALLSLLQSQSPGLDVIDFVCDGYQQVKLAGSADNSLAEMRRDRWCAVHPQPLPPVADAPAGSGGLTPAD